jgi:hypothetical protein
VARRFNLARLTMLSPTKLLFSAALLTASCAHAITLTANFDSLPPYGAGPGSSYSEGGLQFSSPSDFSVVNGYFAGTLFGGGGYGGYMGGNALHVKNNGWVGISTPGQQMDSLTFTYGFDWNFYTIEYGLMDTTFGWMALLDGQLVGSGSQTWGRDNRTHGGFDISIENLGSAFDTLLIRSTAVEYQGIYNPNPQGPGYWFYDRGAQTGHGDTNHIAVDNVRATLATPSQAAAAPAAVPDYGPSIVLIVIAGIGVALLRNRT